jgi:hypothetical protein
MAGLGEYLALAEEICREADELTRRADAAIAAGALQDLRDDVATGLARKIDGAFRALIDDARKERSESMHHLKTMVEAFIYFYVVIDGESDRMARLVLADTWERKALFIDENPGPGNSAEADEWRESARVVRSGLTDELPPLEQLAKSIIPALGPWYSRVYRLACEPAHLGDLLEVMPTPHGLPRRPDSASRHRAVIALHYGGAIEIGLMKAIVEDNTAGLIAPVELLEERLAIVTGARRSRPFWTCSECPDLVERETIQELNVAIGLHIAVHNTEHRERKG